MNIDRPKVNPKIFNQGIPWVPGKLVLKITKYFPQDPCDYRGWIIFHPSIPTQFSIGKPQRHVVEPSGSGPRI